MNARVMILNDGTAAARRAAEIFADELDKPLPEDTGLGFMEYFDWLAGCSDEELLLLTGNMPAFDGGPLSATERHALGSRVWSTM